METGPRESVIRKTQDDGFEDAPLGALLDDAGVKALALCGVPSEMCVRATARTALARDFRVVLPRDAHATYDIPAAPGISERVPAALSSRVAEWALSDEIEIVARPGRRGHLHRPSASPPLGPPGEPSLGPPGEPSPVPAGPPSRPVNRLPSRPVSHLRPGRCAVSPPASWSVNLLPTRPAHCSRPER